MEVVTTNGVRVSHQRYKLYSDCRLSSIFTSVCLPATITQVEEGNVEYKLKLLNPSSSRFEHLVTQMKWRLQEGRGEAIYEIGVADCGYLKGLTEEEMTMSLDTVKRMASKYVIKSLLITRVNIIVLLLYCIVWGRGYSINSLVVAMVIVHWWLTWDSWFQSIVFTHLIKLDNRANHLA